MTPEELMKPRYKVIADYPKSVYDVGTIINAGTTSEDCIYCDREGPRMRHYPHLFKKLQWWEERDEEGMPMLYKHKDYGWVAERIGIDGNYIYFRGRNDEIEWHVQHLLPATREEYEQYLKQKEATNE